MTGTERHLDELTGRITDAAIHRVVNVCLAPRLRASA